MAKVSIIIPIYNVKKYLHHAVNSVISQTEQDIEILLVDDGSTDGSSELCDKFAAEDKRVKVIHKANGGLSSARNAGTQVATSEYILFLDGDDYLRKDAVQILLQTFEKYPSDIIQYRYQEVQESDPPRSKAQKEEIYQVRTSKELFENLYKLGGVAASGATKLMKRELALEIPFINVQHEDEMWCTQAFQRDLIVTYIPDELYYYVMRKNSIIHSKFNVQKMDIFTVIKERIKTLEKLGYHDLSRLEYRKLFMSVISLYVDAKNVDAVDETKKIIDIFEKNKNKIKQHGLLKGKFLLLFKAMCWDPSAVELYRLYTNIRMKKHIGKWEIYDGRT